MDESLMDIYLWRGLNVVRMNISSKLLSILTLMIALILFKYFQQIDKLMVKLKQPIPRSCLSLFQNYGFHMTNAYIFLILKSSIVYAC